MHLCDPEGERSRGGSRIASLHPPAGARGAGVLLSPETMRATVAIVDLARVEAFRRTPRGDRGVRPKAFSAVIVLQIP